MTHCAITDKNEQVWNWTFTIRDCWRCWKLWKDWLFNCDESRPRLDCTDHIFVQAAACLIGKVLPRIHRGKCVYTSHGIGSFAMIEAGVESSKRGSFWKVAKTSFASFCTSTFFLKIFFGANCCLKICSRSYFDTRTQTWCLFILEVQISWKAIVLRKPRSTGFCSRS